MTVAPHSAVMEFFPDHYLSRRTQGIAKTIGVHYIAWQGSMFVQFVSVLLRTNLFLLGADLITCIHSNYRRKSRAFRTTLTLSRMNTNLVIPLDREKMTSFTSTAKRWRMLSVNGFVSINQ